MFFMYVCSIALVLASSVLLEKIVSFVRLLLDKTPSKKRTIDFLSSRRSQTSLSPLLNSALLHHHSTKDDCHFFQILTDFFF